ncbi:MAG: methyltransferase domain-containing protein [Chitinivibrionales bacterium]|nr:methyltransferase domain-containing protein [Chitinivibrionales bacterium]
MPFLYGAVVDNYLRFANEKDAGTQSPRWMMRRCCPLCRRMNVSLIAEDRLRAYMRCADCQLIFVPPEYHVSLQAEKNRYLQHDNSPANKQYVTYLSGVAEKLKHIPLTDPAVLDYGCGREQVLTMLLKRRGYAALGYDPVFGLNPDLNHSRFDIIVMCEVIEHFRNIGDELIRLRTLLKPGGYLLIRTEFSDAVDNFGAWWYKEDITHVNFFSLETMGVLATFLKGAICFANGLNLAIIRSGST